MTKDEFKEYIKSLREINRKLKDENYFYEHLFENLFLFRQIYSSVIKEYGEEILETVFIPLGYDKLVPINETNENGKFFYTEYSDNLDEIYDKYLI